MILTASDVFELSNALTWWERGEYFFSFVVAAACFGEYVADFKPNWYRTGDVERDEKRKESISKRSTLVLVAALVFELVCVARSNTLAGEVIGSIDNLAKDAAAQAKTAVDNAAEAHRLAQSASDTAGPAKTTADEAKRRADAAKGIAEVATTKAEEVNRELSQAAVVIRQHVEDVANPRMVMPITSTFHDDSPRADLFKEVQKFAGTKALIQVVRTDEASAQSEANQVGKDIAQLLLNAGWLPEFTEEGLSHIPNPYVQPGVRLYTLQPSPFEYGPPPNIKLVPVKMNRGFDAERALARLLSLDLGVPPDEAGSVYGQMLNTMKSILRI